MTRLLRTGIAVNSVLALAVGVALLDRNPDRGPVEAAPLPSTTWTVTAEPSSSNAPRESVHPAPTPAAPAPSAPRHEDGEVGRVTIPSLDVDAPLLPVTVQAPEVEPPYWPQDVGIAGAPLDATAGTTLLLGHVNYVGRGTGALAGLSDLTPHAAINVTVGGVTKHWQVVQLADPLKATGVDQSIFDATSGARRLVLVTCGGTVHNGSYDHNVIAYAVPQ